MTIQPGSLFIRGPAPHRCGVELPKARAKECGTVALPRLLNTLTAQRSC